MFKHEIIQLTSSESVIDYQNELADSIGQGRFLGSGIFGSVYEHRYNTKMVLKLCGKDDGYLAYLNAIRKHQGKNPHLPRIFWHKTIINDSMQRNIICMERLDSMSVDPIQNYNQNQFCHKVENILRHLDDGNTTGHPYSAPPYDNDILSLAVCIMDAKNSHSNTQIDLHTGNIMYRGLVPVVTDPLSMC